jgi:ABC-type multidrug transport system fused ATPase/permease subunit
LQDIISLFIQAPWINSSYQAPDNWPDKGQIEFQKLGIRYREDLDLALKEVDCQIYPNEKVFYGNI